MNLVSVALIALATSIALPATAQTASDMQILAQKIKADETAKGLINEAIAIESAEAKLKSSFLPKLGKVIPGTKVARYMQIVSKIRAIVKYQLSASIPLAS